LTSSRLAREGGLGAGRGLDEAADAGDDGAALGGGEVPPLQVDVDDAVAALLTLARSNLVRLAAWSDGRKEATGN
jgi:hypothetical protein